MVDVTAVAVHRGGESGSERRRRLPEDAQPTDGRAGMWAVKPCCHQLAGCLEGPVLGPGNVGWTGPVGTPEVP